MTPDQTSMVVMRRETRSARPARIFSASAVWSDATAEVIGFNTPAVSQVGCAPEGGSG
jgi:hypothetical protein